MAGTSHSLVVVPMEDGQTPGPCPFSLSNACQHFALGCAVWADFIHNTEMLGLRFSIKCNNALVHFSIEIREKSFTEATDLRQYFIQTPRLA